MSESESHSEEFYDSNEDSLASEATIHIRPELRPLCHRIPDYELLYYPTEDEGDN